MGSERLIDAGEALVDVHTNPRKQNAKLMPMPSAKGMFDIMETGHELWRQKYPKTPEAHDYAFTARKPAPGNQGCQPAAGGPVEAAVGSRAGVWDGIEFDKAD